MKTVKSRPDSQWVPHVPLFFRKPTLELAPALLGSQLICHHGNDRVRVGIIVETEAYCGPEDLCAHTARGRLSPRNQAMHGPPGFAYIYRIYGMHLCLNLVSGDAGTPHAILIRALQPVLGQEEMANSHSNPDRMVDTLCRGPGLLCQSLGITMADYGTNLQIPGRLWIAKPPDGAETITPAVSPRIGVTGGEPWIHQPWRFIAPNNPCVSGPSKLNREAISGKWGDQKQKSDQEDL